jgi:hypothetical protein
MCTIPLVGWIANAAARLTGPRGAVTVRALEAGCCRQSVYDHARKVESAVEPNTVADQRGQNSLRKQWSA